MINFGHVIPDITDIRRMYVITRREIPTSQSQKVEDSNSSILVAAIDFGTTYSGWAFSFRHEFELDPIKVSAKNWTGGQLVSSKGPTCVLIKPDGKTFHSFGYDAESKYAELAEEMEQHKNWYFFKRFKMMLFGKIGIHRDIMLEDATEKKLPAKRIFSLCIKYLKDDLLSMSEQRLAKGGLTSEDIHWVLTVPAIWNDAAKQFMREAAEAAGISSCQLTIALEPEAASLYCRHLPVERHVGEKSTKLSLAKFKAGTKYLVLDAGGGTVDITVHEVMEDEKLKELHKASGGAWGGTRVDEAFRQFIIKLVGGPVVKEFQNSHMEDYIDIFRDFEIKKRSIEPDSTGKVTFRMPISLMRLFESDAEEKLIEAIQQTSFADHITLTGDKMRVDVSIVKRFFQEPIDSIVEHVGNLLREPSVHGCAAIVMVGGFSESPMLQETVRKKFPSVKIIVPDEAGLAVLKGAVIFGHKPTVIAERVSKFTYGVKCRQSYEEGRHPENRKVKSDEGEDKVENVFNIYVKAGQRIKINEAFKDSYRVVRADQDGMTIVFYYTANPDPGFIDELGCNKLGTMQVDVPGHGKDRRAEVSLKFGRTEIEATTKVIHTGEVTSTKLDFLG